MLSLEIKSIQNLVEQHKRTLEANSYLSEVVTTQKKEIEELKKDKELYYKLWIESLEKNK